MQIKFDNIERGAHAIRWTVLTEIPCTNGNGNVLRLSRRLPGHGMEKHRHLRISGAGIKRRRIEEKHIRFNTKLFK